jgi:hypothetical protein
MTHPAIALQTALVGALRADEMLAGLLGDAVYDAPPRSATLPYVLIARHDVVARDGDLAPGNDHRLILHLWHPDASRKAVLAIAEAVAAVVLDGPLEPDGLVVTSRTLERTDTVIDPETGAARAALTLRFFTEPSA